MKDKNEIRKKEKLAAQKKSQNVDWGATLSRNAAAFGNKLYFETLPGIKEYILEHWIKMIVLVVSSTQTFSLVKFFAPTWAFWLPYVAVLLIEGATPYWQYREAEADAADGNVDDKVKNKQETIANRMVWVGLVAVCLTMIAGALIEVSNSEVLSSILKPNESVTGLFGWLAIIGVFLFGAIQMYADWQYRRHDPKMSMAREHRAELRTLDRQRQRTINAGEQFTMKYEAAELRRGYNRNAKKVGSQRANIQLRKVLNEQQVDDEQEEEITNDGPLTKNRKKK